jgi:hypothetical protein
MMRQLPRQPENVFFQDSLFVRTPSLLQQSCLSYLIEPGESRLILWYSGVSIPC